MPLSSIPSSETPWLDQQLAAMAAAWGRGERLTPEEILARWPGIDSESAIRLIYEDVCLRRESGIEVETAEVLRRFPEWADELEVLLDCDRLLSQPGDVPVFPEIGQTLGPFRLLAELGRGAAGRTYLAAESALADRQVVVKVIPDDQDEHLALARLQHTHIVPLFSEHAVPEAGLRVLCMPYLAGASLEQILDELAKFPIPQRNGRRIVEVLDRFTRKGPLTPGLASRYRKRLEESNYVEAITWIVACLADGLNDAHARGLVHMDVKPSNVLISGDGQPMLLDFHLARGPVLPGTRVVDRLGGTREWMSPEQEAAMEAINLGRPVATAVDGRSDIYALGLLLRELLRGHELSDWVRDIIATCLAPRPEDRYQSISTLADDLLRHRVGLRPRGVTNRGRFRTWLQESRGGLAAVLACVAILVALYYYQQRARQTELARALQTQQSLETWTRLTDELHTFADQTRLHSSVVLPGPSNARPLVDRIAEIWKHRDRLVSLEPPAPSANPETLQRIKDDLLELVTIWVNLRLRDGGDRARAEMAHVVAEAERVFDHGFALESLRRRVEGKTDEGGNTVAPHSAREHYALGRSLLTRGQTAQALDAFRLAVEIEPNDLWSNFFEGLCAYRLHRYEDAVAAFRTCIALQPRQAQFYYNRALAHDALGQTDLARRDYTQALKSYPDFAQAAINRAIISYKAGQFDQAANDFERALNATRAPEYADSPLVGRIHYNLALTRLAQGRREEARQEVEKAVNQGNAEAQALFKELAGTTASTARPRDR